MNNRGEKQVRILCVGADFDDGDGLSGFDVRHVEAVDDARVLLDGGDDDPTDQWYPDCIVSAALNDTGGDDGLDFLRWVGDHTPRVATVLAPGTDGDERLASRAVAAGITGYCLASDSLEETVRAAVERVRLVRGPDHDHSADRRYRTLAENLPNGAVALYDRDLRYLVIGGTVFDDLELDRDQLEGKRLEDVHSGPYLEQYLPLYRAALDGERSEFEFAYRGHVYRGHTVPVRNQDDEVVAGMALTQDVTDEHERRARLERQNQRLDRFAGVVSHDLRSPLNVIGGSLALLREAARDGDGDLVEENVDRISRACRRMDDIIDNVLTLARHSREVEALEDVSFEETVSRVWKHVDAPDATLVVDVGTDEEVTVRADARALSRLLENLLSNAVEHGSTAGAEAVTVRVEWFDGDDHGFAVADDGPGMTAEEREQAFEWGYTTDRTGSGLGLSIVESVCEAHGWSVSVTESAIGGARFEVRDVVRVTAANDATERND